MLFHHPLFDLHDVIPPVLNGINSAHDLIFETIVVFLVWFSHYMKTLKELAKNTCIQLRG